jgi:hypothetical protein
MTPEELKQSINKVNSITIEKMVKLIDEKMLANQTSGFIGARDFLYHNEQYWTSEFDMNDEVIQGLIQHYDQLGWKLKLKQAMIGRPLYDFELIDKSTIQPSFWDKLFKK